MKRCAGVILPLLAFGSTAAMAVEVRILSAGAVEPGLHAFAERAGRETGHELKIQFNTGPQIAKRLAAGEAYDILIAPPAVIGRAIKDNQVVADSRMPLGRVGAGMVMRAGASLPDVASVEALKRALLGADSLVYNTASTGLYLDKLFEKLGIAGAIKAKTTRYPNGEGVMEHVIHGKGNEIGFGAITEIRMYASKGLQLVGPLPAEVQNYTSYEAALMTGAAAAAAGAVVLRQLATPEARQAFTAAGIE